MQFSLKLLKIPHSFTLPSFQWNNWTAFVIVVGIFFMKEIILNTGDKALVDDENFEALNQYKWKCKKQNHTSYAYRVICSHKYRANIWMHKDLLGINSNLSVRGDHRDFNGLNNQKSNLRICTHAQNNCYKRSAKNSTSKYLGVSFCKQTGRWAATIFKNYKQKRLGRFVNEKDAAIAYNEAAKVLHGEFANLNIID